MAAKRSSSNKDENHSSSSSKTSSSSARPQEQALKCPRCDSQNTKFCYYNNYSLTQPRHFCKTCRRYWTKGGALRNVQIGGSCRKNKKTKPTSRLSNLDSKDTTVPSTDIGGLKFFHGLTPAMDFQLGGLGFPRLHSSSPTGGLYSQFSSFGDVPTTSCSIGSTPCFSPDPSGRYPLMGFNFPFSSMLKPVENSSTAAAAAAAAAGFTSGELQEIGSLNHHHSSLASSIESLSSINQDLHCHHHSSLASSIESLSSINQDLHWKLQLQRLAMLFGGENQKESSLSSVPLGNQVQKPQPIMFHSLETPKTSACAEVVANDDSASRKEGSGNGNGTLSTEWFFDNSYPPVTPTPANSGNNGNDQNVNNWNGIQAWSNMSQYSAL